MTAYFSSGIFPQDEANERTIVRTARHRNFLVPRNLAPRDLELRNLEQCNFELRNLEQCNFELRNLELHTAMTLVFVLFQDDKKKQPENIKAALAGNRNRTGTAFKCRGILSPLCLPIPPSRRKIILNILIENAS